MNAKAELVMGIIILAIAVPGGVWVIWCGIRTGETALRIDSGTGLGSSKGIPASRSKNPGFFWFTIFFYILATSAALVIGFRAIVEALHKVDKLPPNATLEQTVNLH